MNKIIHKVVANIINFDNWYAVYLWNITIISLIRIWILISIRSSTNKIHWIYLLFKHVWNFPTVNNWTSRHCIILQDIKYNNGIPIVSFQPHVPIAVRNLIKLCIRQRWILIIIIIIIITNQVTFGMFILLMIRASKILTIISLIAVTFYIL